MSEPGKQNQEIPDKVELPAPTVWPMVTAFGITLVCAGFVTFWAVSLVGFLLAVRGFYGWWFEVLPHDRHEYVPVVAPELRAKPIEAVPRTVEHLKFGKEGHRVRIPTEVHPYSSGILGGLVGGAVMAVLAVAWSIWKYGSLWYTVNLMSAAVLPSLAQADVETLKAFSFMGLVIAVVVHGILSVLIGLLYAVALPMFPKYAWLWAGILTPLFWTALFHASIGVLNPALGERVDWFWFVICQLGYGMVGGYVVFKSGKVETMQTWPLAQRAGIEAAEPGGEKHP